MIPKNESKLAIDEILLSAQQGNEESAGFLVELLMTSAGRFSEEQRTKTAKTLASFFMSSKVSPELFEKILSAKDCKIWDGHYRTASSPTGTVSGIDVNPRSGEVTHWEMADYTEYVEPKLLSEYLNPFIEQIVENYRTKSLLQNTSELVELVDALITQSGDAEQRRKQANLLAGVFSSPEVTYEQAQIILAAKNSVVSNNQTLADFLYRAIQDESPRRIS